MNHNHNCSVFRLPENMTREYQLLPIGEYQSIWNIELARIIVQKIPDKSIKKIQKHKQYKRNNQ